MSFNTANRNPNLPAGQDVSSPMKYRFSTLSTVFAGRCLSEHERFISLMDSTVAAATPHTTTRTSGRLRGLVKLCEERVRVIEEFIQEHVKLYGDFDQDRVRLFFKTIENLKDARDRALGVNRDSDYYPNKMAAAMTPHLAAERAKKLKSKYDGAEDDGLEDCLHAHSGGTLTYATPGPRTMRPAQERGFLTTDRNSTVTDQTAVDGTLSGITLANSSPKKLGSLGIRPSQPRTSSPQASPTGSPRASPQPVSLERQTSLSGSPRGTLRNGTEITTDKSSPKPLPQDEERLEKRRKAKEGSPGTQAEMDAHRDIRHQLALKVIEDEEKRQRDALKAESKKRVSRAYQKYKEATALLKATVTHREMQDRALSLSQTESPLEGRRSGSANALARSQEILRERSSSPSSLRQSTTTEHGASSLSASTKSVAQVEAEETNMGVGFIHVVFLAIGLLFGVLLTHAFLLQNY